MYKKLIAYNLNNTQCKLAKILNNKLTKEEKTILMDFINNDLNIIFGYIQTNKEYLKDQAILRIKQISEFIHIIGENK